MVDVSDSRVSANGSAALVESAPWGAVDPVAERYMQLERHGERMARRAKWAAALGVFGLLLSSYLLATLQYHINLQWDFLEWLFPEAFAESELLVHSAVGCTVLVGLAAIVAGWRGAGRSNRLFRGLAVAGIVAGLVSLIFVILFVVLWREAAAVPFIYVIF